MTIDSPEFDVRGGTPSVFLYNYTELGAARWYELDRSGQTQRICLSQGATIWRRVFDIFRELASNADDTRQFREFRLEDGLSPQWFPPLLAFARRFVVGRAQQPQEQALIEGLSLNPDSAAFRQKAEAVFELITKMFVWVAFYQQYIPDSAVTSPSRNIFSFTQIGLPPHTIYFDFSRFDSGFPANVEVPERPVCYRADVRLRIPDDNPNLPMPTPLDETPVQTHDLPGSVVRPQKAQQSDIWGGVLTAIGFSALSYLSFRSKK